MKIAAIIRAAIGVSRSGFILPIATYFLPSFINRHSFFGFPLKSERVTSSGVASILMGSSYLDGRGRLAFAFFMFSPFPAHYIAKISRTTHQTQQWVILLFVSGRLR